MCVCVCLLKSFLNKFCGELVSACEEYLSTILLNERGTENLNEDLLVRPDLVRNPKISFLHSSQHNSTVKTYLVFNILLVLFCTGAVIYLNVHHYGLTKTKTKILN